MKIGIITHYDVHNHGALLQLFGLVSFLRERGFEAFALKYSKNYDFMDADSFNKYNISIKSIPFYFRYLKQNGLKKVIFFHFCYLAQHIHLFKVLLVD